MCFVFKVDPPDIGPINEMLIDELVTFTGNRWTEGRLAYACNRLWTPS